MVLSNVEIEYIISSDPCVSRIFQGVYPSCCLPRELIRAPAALIINLDEHFKSGSHWVAIAFRNEGTVEYFDSYGLPPSNKNILLFLERNAKYNWIYNKMRYEGDLSTVCGYNC